MYNWLKKNDILLDRLRIPAVHERLNMDHPCTPDMPAQKPTVLVIDDEAGPRDALKVILRPFFNIHSADIGQVGH